MILLVDRGWNSEARELCDLSVLLRRIGKLDADRTDGQLQCGSLTPSPLIHIHTVSVFRNDCKTHLLLILCSIQKANITNVAYSHSL